MPDVERISGITRLVDWANNQDHWVRVLVSAVLDTRRSLSNEVVTELYEILLQEKELSASENGPVSVPPIEHDDRPLDQENALRIRKLSGVVDVNALAPDQDICFNAQMTVLYGENGTGKTGYVRILKQLAAVRTAEPILPNIARSNAPGTPTAVIAYELGEKTENCSWTGEEGISPFTQMDVFDAQGVDVHVDGELTYCYTPGELAVFSYTHKAIEAVKESLETARKDTLPTGNPYRNKFSRDGTLYAKIETLGETTDLPAFEALAALTPEECAEIDPLQERVDALRSGTSAAKLQVAESERDVFDRVARALTVAEAFDQTTYSRTLEAMRNAEKAHTRATEEALASETIPGALDQTWREFIEAGEAYIAEYKSDDYPQDGDTCPYCLQDLSAASIAVVQKYRAFCRSDLQEAVDDARAALRKLTEDACAQPLEQLAQVVESRIEAISEGESPHESLLAARSFVAEFQRAQEALVKSVDLEAPTLEATIRAAQPLVEARRSTLDKLIDDLCTDVADRNALLTSKTDKLRELRDRLTLSELIPGIRDHVANAKWASRAKTIVQRFPPLARALTETAKLASEQLLNHDFEATFINECDALRAPPVTLDFPGRRGRPARRKSLTPQHRLSATLSEGEQKVIALADFIAEATLRRSSTPLVLDDPVTSLDYKRLQHVVDRLVELSESRQVVVFTHNIWFTMELLARFDRNRKACTYYYVSKVGQEYGLVSAGESPRLDTWSDKKKRINKMIDRAEQESDKTMHDVLVEKGYDDLRGACEIIVERDLLMDVVQSHRPNVMVANLLRVRFEDLPEASATVNKIFDRCCRFTGAHKQPLETLSVRPSLDQLKEDWRALQKIHSQFSK